jgi:hypothetical protein
VARMAAGAARVRVRHTMGAARTLRTHRPARTCQPPGGLGPPATMWCNLRVDLSLKSGPWVEGCVTPADEVSYGRAPQPTSLRDATGDPIGADWGAILGRRLHFMARSCPPRRLRSADPGGLKPDAAASRPFRRFRFAMLAIWKVESQECEVHNSRGSGRTYVSSKACQDRVCRR